MLLISYFSIQTSFKLDRECALRLLTGGAACGNSAPDTENKKVSESTEPGTTHVDFISTRQHAHNLIRTPSEDIS